MNRVLFTLVVLLCSTSIASAQGKGGANKNGWYSDYSSAKAEARRTGKPIFLVFRCEP